MLQRNLSILTLALMVSACHMLAPNQQQPPAPENKPAPSESAAMPASGDAAPPSGEDSTKAESAELPPCLPADNNPKPAPKRKPKPVIKAEPPPPAPVAAQQPKAAEEAGVKTVSTPSASILGKRVRGLEGDDLGRVVDVLADAQGRVRIAVIEFGGFLGVGNRHIAVDWSLLKFQPDDPDAPVLLNVPRAKLQSTPEYKGAERPAALMGPEASAAPRPTMPH
jgi:hypothetical protein